MLFIQQTYIKLIETLIRSTEGCHILLSSTKNCNFKEITVDFNSSGGFKVFSDLMFIDSNFVQVVHSSHLWNHNTCGNM